MSIKNLAIQKAIDCFGGSQVELARNLNVTRAQVWQWLNYKNSISLEKAIDIEDKTNGQVTCEELIPDVNWSVLRNRSG